MSGFRMTSRRNIVPQVALVPVRSLTTRIPRSCLAGDCPSFATMSCQMSQPMKSVTIISTVSSTWAPKRRADEARTTPDGSPSTWSQNWHEMPEPHSRPHDGHGRVGSGGDRRTASADWTCCPPLLRVALPRNTCRTHPTAAAAAL